MRVPGKTYALQKRKRKMPSIVIYYMFAALFLLEIMAISYFVIKLKQYILLIVVVMLVSLLYCIVVG